MQWRRGIGLALGVIGDMREASWSRERHPDRVSTDRDRTLRDEGGDAVSHRQQALRCTEDGDATGAVEPYEQLLAERVRAWGEDHPLVLGTRLTLAGLRGETGDAAGAAQAFGQLLAATGPLLGEGHPYTRWARRNLAYWESEDLAPRRRRNADAVLPAERMPGAHGTAALRRLVMWRCREGFEAREVFSLLLAGMNRALGHGHPYARRVHLALDPRWEGVGRVPQRSRGTADRGLPTERMLRREHPVTGSFQRLAQMRRNTGDAAGAVAASEQLLARRLRVLGEDHSLVLFSRLYLGGLRGEAGDAAGAVESLEQLLTDLLRVVGEEHPFVLFTRLHLAGLLRDAGDDG